MGQRHQAYVIARQGQRYRCIAALHHQWCYGRGPLRAAAQFLTLVQQPQNAWIIRKELDEPTRSAIDYEDHIAIPYPFTNQLLSLAFAVNLDPAKWQLSVSKVLAEPVDCGSTKGDNNDGITVLDISNPFSPSYCFVSIYGLSVESRDFPDLVPLSAETYVRAYYPKQEISFVEHDNLESSVEAAIQSLSQYPVISLQTLHATWPDEYEGEAEAETLSNTIPANATQNNKDDDGVALSVVPSLVDAIFRRAVEQAIATNTIDELEPFLIDEVKVNVIKDILQAQNPIEDGGSFLLLKRLLQMDLHPKCIDLSSLHLSKDQLQRLFREQSWVDSVDQVDVSGMTHFDVDVLRELVGRLPNLRRLNLWNTAVTGHQLHDVLDSEPHLFYRIERLIHPIFFNQSESSILAPALSFIIVEKKSIYRSPGFISVPYFTPSQLVQGFLDIFGPILKARKGGRADPFSDWDFVENILWTGAFASEVRQQGTSWSERVIPYIPSYARENLNFHAHQWFFMLDEDMKYAFGRFIPEVGQSLPAELKASKAAYKGEKETWEAEVKKVVDRMKSEHGRLFKLFDVREFFDALKQEGRLPPDPKALNLLLEVFAELSSLKAPSRRKVLELKVMTQSEFEDGFSYSVAKRTKR